MGEVQGYGHAYVVFPFKHIEHFRKLQAFARQAEKGLWAKAEPAPKVKPPVATPPATVRQPVRPVEKDVTVYVTRTGKKYHRGNCRYLRRSKIAISLDDAKTRYSPCSVCKPPR